MDTKPSTIFLAAALVAISVKLYIQHRSPQYEGEFNEGGRYRQVTPLKHDIIKALTTDLFPLLVYGLASNEPFFDQNNILGSKAAKMLVCAASYFVYYEFVEPHISTKLPRF